MKITWALTSKSETLAERQYGSIEVAGKMKITWTLTSKSKTLAEEQYGTIEGDQMPITQTLRVSDAGCHRPNMDCFFSFTTS